MLCITRKKISAPAMNAAIVDSLPGDYGDLPQRIKARAITWRLLTSGREALRLALTQGVDLWIINTVLADMSGIDLCRMLKTRSPPPVCYIVTDAYRAEEERAARTCGAALFERKPIRSCWFRT